MNYARIADLVDQARKDHVGVYLSTPGVALYCYDCVFSKWPGHVFNHSVLACSEEDGADQLKRTYLYTDSPITGKTVNWISYKLRSIATWDGAKLSHRRVNSAKVMNRATSTGGRGSLSEAA